MEYKVICGNNVDLLKIFPDNHFDSIVTDPPYGLGKEPIASDLMKDWIEKGYHEISGSGFMGKEWDAFVPQPIFWKEVFRVLKPGGHVLAFYGTRTYDWGVMAMRFAGFEVRDCIQWLYGSGFPKSHNISKALDKMEGAEREVGKLKFKGGTQLGVINDDSWKPKDVYETYSATESAKQWDGWGSALKPANEPIVLARKPLEKGLSIAENILKWGVGGINIDASRIGSVTENDPNHRKPTNIQHGSYDNTKNVYGNSLNGRPIENLNPQGRFPANIILTHHEDCECKGTKKVKAIKGGRIGNKNGAYSGIGAVGFSKEFSKGDGGYGDENGQEELENWDCHEDCPIRILDEQSGVRKSEIAVKRNLDGRTYNENQNWGLKAQKRQDFGYMDKGGASRFFYVAKASKSERNKGLNGFEIKQTIGGGGTYNEDAGAKYGSIKAEGKNFHPTVKPIKLMQYLVKMITPPNGIVLDPFCGSGTTGVACKLDGFQFVGLEQDPEYFRIAEARINNMEVEIESQLKLF